MFKRVLYNSLFNFLDQNDLISLSLASSQVTLVLTHEIYHSVEEGYEIRGVSLDISKAFDKV